MKALIVVAAAALPLLAASADEKADKKMAGMHAAAGRAVAVLHAAPGISEGSISQTAISEHPLKGKVEGTVWFDPAAGGVKVKARVSGLTPGTHGFHVHEFGDCSAADFTSAGGHFNPMAQPHGAPQAAARHVGDLGNIEAGADGVASLDWTDTQLAFEGHHGIIGRAVIVHAKADDLKTQPTGDAGGRLACGVIGVAKTP
jgi:Cu-Zn family superoxide dismutase